MIQTLFSLWVILQLFILSGVESTRRKIRLLKESERLENEILVSLPSRNQEELDQFLIDLYNKTSDIYQQYLDPITFCERFCPTTEQVKSVTDYLRSHELDIIDISKNKRLIRVKGAVKSLNSAFRVKLHKYESLNKIQENGKEEVVEFVSPDTDSLFLFNGIQNVIGLDNSTRRISHKRRKNGKSRIYQRPLTPFAIRNAYDIPTTSRGVGQSVALFQLDNYYRSEIEVYKNRYNVGKNTTLVDILLPDAPIQPGEDQDEVCLDIELVMAMAPDIETIYVYIAPNTDPGAIMAYNQIAVDNFAKSVSTSWGLCELCLDRNTLEIEHAIFQQMAAQGQTIFAASGDDGAFDNGDNIPAVDDPASQPFVTGVGGTTLRLNPDLSYRSEITWWQGPKLGGSGGGISDIWLRPAWQVDAIKDKDIKKKLYRTVPDVALQADPSVGYAIYTKGSWQRIGGTSCAAPLFAAFNALVNERRAENDLPPIGFANPVFYSLGSSFISSFLFHDIKTGNNGKYSALTGYDLATGWGSMIGSNLLATLAVPRLNNNVNNSGSN